MAPAGAVIVALGRNTRAVAGARGGSAPLLLRGLGLRRLSVFGRRRILPVCFLPGSAFCRAIFSPCHSPLSLTLPAGGVLLGLILPLLGF